MEFPHLSLTVTVSNGATIEEASREAMSLANSMEINVSFDFNGVLCHAYCGGSSDNLIASFNKIQEAQNSKTFLQKMLSGELKPYATSRYE